MYATSIQETSWQHLPTNTSGKTRTLEKNTYLNSYYLVWSPAWFQKGCFDYHSCHAAENIFEAYKQGELLTLALYDLTKAFVVVSHSVLLAKLARYGVLGKAHEMISSCLLDRRPVVSEGVDVWEACIQASCISGVCTWYPAICYTCKWLGEWQSKLSMLCRRLQAFVHREDPAAGYGG